MENGGTSTSTVKAISIMEGRNEENKCIPENCDKCKLRNCRGCQHLEECFDEIMEV